jgi:hypothetical protein
MKYQKVEMPYLTCNSMKQYLFFKILGCYEYLCVHDKNIELMCLNTWNMSTTPLHIKNEIQEAHWHSMSITILVHITYRLNLDADLEKLGIQLLKEIHFYMYDDGKHDGLFVQHCLCLH